MIGDLVARYNAQGDAGRVREMLALFTDDAVLWVDGEEHRGVVAIGRLFDGAVASTRARGGGRLQHFTATHQVDFSDPEHAEGRSYFQVLTESGLDHWGRYVDRYRKVESHWRFASRRVELLGRVAGGWADRRLRRERSC